MILKLTYGDVEIELYPDKAPNHVKRFKELSDGGKYDGVVFHRVIGWIYGSNWRCKIWKF
tara:strand:- start:236 stop:415 length:180 start_codon:yes stop_codon:yes gene_type:complete